MFGKRCSIAFPLGILSQIMAWSFSKKTNFFKPQFLNSFWPKDIIQRIYVYRHPTDIVFLGTVWEVQMCSNRGHWISLEQNSHVAVSRVDLKDVKPVKRLLQKSGRRRIRPITKDLIVTLRNENICTRNWSHYWMASFESSWGGWGIEALVVSFFCSSKGRARLCFQALLLP